MSDDSIQKEAELMFNVVRERYGDRLDDEQLEEVKKGVEGIFEAAESLRKIKLENSDEPFSLFVPYRKGD
ncbi:MAG: hypothetical protein IH861_09965 [Chloroflexi bacterium]|nr:hypothetical protein [Chloroflexota bacterium]